MTIHTNEVLKTCSSLDLNKHFASIFVEVIISRILKSLKILIFKGEIEGQAKIRSRWSTFYSKLRRAAHSTSQEWRVQNEPNYGSFWVGPLPLFRVLLYHPFEKGYMRVMSSKLIFRSI